MERVASTPVGQQALLLLDGVLHVTEDAIGWLDFPAQSPNSKDEAVTNGDRKESKNGHSAYPETPPKPERPLPWSLFLPFLISLRFSLLSVNLALRIIRTSPVEYESVRCKLQEWRERGEVVRASGLKALDERRVETAKRLQDHPPQLNAVCRTFSKWPLRLFVRRIRKILNFLGVITLPRPGSPPPDMQIEDCDLPKEKCLNGRRGHEGGWTSKNSNHQEPLITIMPPQQEDSDPEEDSAGGHATQEETDGTETSNDKREYETAEENESDQNSKTDENQEGSDTSPPEDEISDYNTEDTTITESRN